MLFLNNRSFNVNLGDKYNIVYGAKDEFILVGPRGNIVIPGHVIAFSHNNEYVIIYQKPIGEMCDCDPVCFINTHNSTQDSSFFACKKAFQKSTTFQYWIVKKTPELLYGPFSHQEYANTLRKLNLPNFTLNPLADSPFYGDYSSLIESLNS